MNSASVGSSSATTLQAAPPRTDSSSTGSSPHQGPPVRLQLCLVSHTNAGKTTLARTLLLRDVGEVRDAAHVTETADAHTLLTSPDGDELTLWDTPGFGDSVRLAKRLGQAGNPVGWFLSEVWDRMRDRPFYLSQRALLAARDHADVVLYLVNASEDPQDAGYVVPEMQLLQWLGKPVVVLLNQMGPPAPAHAEQADVRKWSRALRSSTVVRAVLPMDAFARCWVHEGVLFESLVDLAPADKREGARRLVSTWEARNTDRFETSMRALADLLAVAARDKEPIADTSTPFKKH
ncbi:GTPase domain-containing protein [Pigmentiphaga litoralis]|uniref:GTPase domain-containing protein n=1 Tax=Pigmentiphaga litoralis TaxID=516702 RepID=UPI003B431E73